jgi:hypothetical protein
MARRLMVIVAAGALEHHPLRVTRASGFGQAALR